MQRIITFSLLLITGLAGLTYVAAQVVQQTTRAWFDKDIVLRSQLVIASAHQVLVDRWSTDDKARLTELLNELSRDERIMGVAACDAHGEMIASTPTFGTTFSCGALVGHVREEDDTPAARWKPFHERVRLLSGIVQVSAIPLIDGGRSLGFLCLLHDLAYLDRREAKTREFLLIAFGVLGIAAALLTFVAARLAWRGWSRDLQRFLRQGKVTVEFQPIMRDVRDLIDRIVTEREVDGEAGAWTPERLKLTLNRYLHGEKVVLMANREPYIHEHVPNSDAIRVVHPASGLVTALEPVMRACSGTWVAHGSGNADRETSDRHSRLAVPPEERSYVLRRVWLTPQEEAGYYYGFSNEGLWPLCHIAHARPIFRSEDWKHYQEVNRKFADAVCAEVDTEDPIILVQDYHFALAPKLIRQRLPRATIITFWHIPWPNSQRFGICPWGKELLEGMLGSSIIGFHTRFDGNNFVDAVDRLLEARIDREQNAVVQRGRPTLVRPYPISLEWPNRWLRNAASIEECRRRVFERLGLPGNAYLGVGVDRLDYTKGVEERLLTIERLLERFSELRGRFTFVQLAAPSRTVIERYRELNESVERIAERVNQRFGDGTYRPIVLLRAHHEPPTVFEFYRAADVCYVSSLHDGMNLVAKEYIAARDDEDGVLVLSQFTGAARELTEALVVNPYDLDDASSALAAALKMDREEKRARMRSMRSFIAEFNVYRWAGRMLVDAARLRSRERLTGKLSDRSTAWRAEPWG